MEILPTCTYINKMLFTTLRAWPNMLKGTQETSEKISL